MGRLFGTDGARGVANTELTCELAMAIGRAAAMVLIEVEHRRPRVVIGKDTRVSSDMLEAAMVAGLCSVGADAQLLGVVPTPAVAYLVKEYEADAGIMISASHNPCEYNGIKIFNGEGYKLSDALEEEIEAIVLDGAKTPPCPSGGEIGRVSRCDRAVDDYVRHLLSVTDVSLRGMRLAVDCANGSASATARKLFSALGADCVFLNDQPDGVNINENCGSTHIEQLAEFVKKLKYFGGVAFDGDADRCLAVDENGNLVDGDKIIAALALDMKEKGELDGNAAVATVMSNMGLFRFCEEHDITPVTTKVGDRYVLEEMLKSGYAIGGEQSGHIIFRHHATTGDGQLTALQFLQILKRSGKKASELAGICPQYPQVLVNVRLENVPGLKERIMDAPELRSAAQQEEEAMAGEGRVLVRASGTEPLIRVMVEAESKETCRKYVDSVVEVLRAKGHAC